MTAILVIDLSTFAGTAGKSAKVAALRARGFNPADDNEADALALQGWTCTQEPAPRRPT